MIKNWLKAHWFDVLLLFVLVLAGIKLTYRIEDIVDLPFFDETFYMNRGLLIPDNGFPGPEKAPLYSVWYLFLSTIQPDPIQLYYLNYVLSVILLPVCFYVLLRVQRVSAWIAMLAACWILVLSENLSILRVASVGAIPVLIALTVATVCSSYVLGFVVCAAGALIGSFIRPELFLVFLLSLACCGVAAGLRKFRLCRLEWGGIALAAFLAIGLMLTFGRPIGGDGGRRWVAFSQHFSLRWVTEHNLPRSPWTECESIVQEVFGDVTSIREACMAEPSIFINHIAGNIGDTPKVLWKVLTDHLPLLEPGYPELVKMEGWLIGLILLAGLIWQHKFVRQCFFDNLRRRHRMWIGALLFSAPSIVSIFLIYPRSHYFLLPAILLFATIMVLFAGETDQPGQSKRLSVFSVLLLAFVILAVVPSFAVHAGRRRYLPNRRVVEFVREMNLNQPVVFLEAEGGYGVYCGRQFTSILHYRKDKPYGAYMREHGINAIVVSRTLVEDVRYRTDPEWQSFFKNFEQQDFKRIDIPQCDRFLLLHSSLLPRRSVAKPLLTL